MFSRGLLVKAVASAMDLTMRDSRLNVEVTMLAVCATKGSPASAGSSIGDSAAARGALGARRSFEGSAVL